MDAMTLCRPDHLGLFPRSRLFSGRGRPPKSMCARVFAMACEKRARVVRAGQPTLSEKAGTREQRERPAAPGGRNQPPGLPCKHSADTTPAAAVGAVPLRRADLAALVSVLETQGRFIPAPPAPPWADPRPDLVGDHVRWLTLLELAHRRDAADPYGVFGALVGIRCCGAALTSSGGANPAWRLARGEMTAAEWQAVRTQWLMPHLKVLRDLLGPAAATTEGAHTP